MRLSRAVPKIPTKSSVPPRLPFHNNQFLLIPSQSTLPQLLIPLHFNSFRSSVYKKSEGWDPTAKRRVCQLVTHNSPRLRTRRNPRNPSAFIELLHNLRTPGGGGGLIACSGTANLGCPHSKLHRLLSYTIHYSHPLLTRCSSFQGKIYPNKSRSHNV
jgi:hypothetical protein